MDEQADQLVAVATEQGFPVWGAVGTIHRGWVKVKNGDVAEGMSLPAQRLGGLPCHRDGTVDAPFSRPSGQGM